MAVDFQEPPASLNYVNLALGGVAIETAHPALNMRGTRLAYDRTGDLVYARVGTGAGGGTAAWRSLNGGTNLNLGKYWVAPAGNVPSAPYALPSAAVTAAVADGHTAANPAVVFVWPASYTDAVTLQPGVSIVNLAGVEGGVPLTTSPTPNVVLSGPGTITGAFVAASSVALKGITATTLAVSAGTSVAVQDCAFTAVTVANTLASSVSLDRVQVVPAAGDGITVGILGAACALVLNEVIAVGAAGGGVGLNCSDASNQANLTGSATVSQIATLTANGTAATFRGTWTCRDVLHTGAITVASTGAVTCTECSINGGTAAAITFTANGQVNYTDGVITSSNATVVTGNGTLKPIKVAWVGRNTLQAGAVATGPLAISRAIYRSAALTAADVPTWDTNLDFYPIDTTAAGRAVTLPAANTLPLGTPLSVTNAAGANVVTVGPTGGDTIRGGTTLAASVAGKYVNDTTTTWTKAA